MPHITVNRRQVETVTIELTGEEARDLLVIASMSGEAFRRALEAGIPRVHDRMTFDVWGLKKDLALQLGNIVDLPHPEDPATC